MYQSMAGNSVSSIIVCAFFYYGQCNHWEMYIFLPPFPLFLSKNENTLQNILLQKIKNTPKIFQK